MKSRISIDLDESNNPIIKIEYAQSDDVRDKMVKRFLEGFGGSRWAKFHFMPHPQSTSNSVAVIFPISSSELHDVAKLVLDDAGHLPTPVPAENKFAFTGSLGTTNPELRGSHTTT